MESVLLVHQREKKEPTEVAKMVGRCRKDGKLAVIAIVSDSPFLQISWLYTFANQSGYTD